MEVVDAKPSGDDSWDGFVLESCRKLAGLSEAYLSPGLPPEVLSGALATYLHLQPGELLMAILDDSGGERPDRGCALTTRRLYWAGPPQSPWAGPTTSGDPESGASPPRCRSVAFEELGEPVYRSRYLTRGIELGGGQAAPVPGLGGVTQEALAGVLNAVGRAARDGLPEAPTPQVVAAHQEQLRAILWQTGEARSLQQKGHSFEKIARSASPRVIAMPLFVAICVGTFAIMAARGVSPIEPTAQELYPWGANFGPGVIVDGQVWRLVSCTFLHFGLMHLAFNMWCLVKAGSLAERLFGHLGFTALYLLSGLGGSLASLWYHPMVISAGASGAIFGLFGALLGCSVVRSHALPTSAWKPLRASVLTFIAYNIFFGLMSSGIDNAAHLGGLFTGGACGLILSRPKAASGRASGQVRRLIGAAGIACGLGLLYVMTRGAILARIEADPGIARHRAVQQLAVDAYNGFIGSAEPRMIEFDRLGSECDAIARRVDQAEEPKRAISLDLDRLIVRSAANEESMRAIVVEDSSLHAARDHLASAQRHLSHNLKLMRAFLDGRNERILEGPDGYAAHIESLRKEADSFRRLIAEYVKAHELVIKAP
jgi:rhomboid protease GluP